MTFLSPIVNQYLQKLYFSVSGLTCNYVAILLEASCQHGGDAERAGNLSIHLGAGARHGFVKTSGNLYSSAQGLKMSGEI